MLSALMYIVVIIKLQQNLASPKSVELQRYPAFVQDPKCANGSNFCENFEHYPYQKIEDVLKLRNIDKNLFFSDNVASMSEHRNAEFEESRDFCRTRKMNVFPRLARNTKDEWRLIVNQRKNGYVQAISIEQCIFPEGECEVVGKLPEGYSTFCKQKFVYRMMYAVDAIARRI